MGARKAKQNPEKHSSDSVKFLGRTDRMGRDLPSKIESKSKSESNHKSRNSSDPAAEKGSRVDMDEIYRELWIDIGDDEDMDEMYVDVSHRDLNKKGSKYSQHHPTTSELKTKIQQKHNFVTDQELQI